jgi:hypothetical protein
VSMKTERKSEFANFDKVMGDLLSVPHSEIKAKLEAEKKAKATKKASRRPRKNRLDNQHTEPKL